MEEGIGFVPAGGTILGYRLVNGNTRVWVAPGERREPAAVPRGGPGGELAGLGLGGLPKVTLRVPCEPLGLGTGWELELVVLASDVRDPRTA